MNDFNNLYLIFIISGVILFLYNSFKPKRETFINPIVRPLKAVGRMASQLPDILGMLAEAAINFMLNFIDMFIALFEALAWVQNIPFNILDSISYIVTGFSDILLLISLWVNPVTMIKSIIKLVFFLLKLIFNTIFGIFKTIGRHYIDKLFDGIRGSLWGIPHGPDQHIEHPDGEGSTIGVRTGNISRTDLGVHGHHHAGELSEEDSNNDKFVELDRSENDFVDEDDGTGGFTSFKKTASSDEESWKGIEITKHEYDNGTKQLYQPMRCYRGIGANGYINVVAMIICPPLGVFMSYGLKGIFKILVCAGLTLLYYFPGLIYGLLITTHLGLGRDINMSECGGEFAGVVIRGCPKRKSKEACEEADIPNKLDINGDPIKACIWDADEHAKYGGVCRNMHIRYGDYAKYKSRTTKFEYTDSGPRRMSVTKYQNPNFDNIENTKDRREEINKVRYDMNANRTKESTVYAGVRDIWDAKDVPNAIDIRNKFNKDRKSFVNNDRKYSKFEYQSRDSPFKDNKTKEEKIKSQNDDNIGEDARTFNIPDEAEEKKRNLNR